MNRVSICIPTHDPDPGYLAQLLSSVADQKYADLEVVISDDASAVDVASMLDPFPDQLDIRFRRNRTNLGMAPNWNASVEASTGTLVMVVHQDDLLAPGMVDCYVSEFTQDGTVVLCSCAELFIGADGQPSARRQSVNRRSRIYRRRSRYVLDHREMARLCLRNGQAFGEPSAVMFRRQAFDAVGGYDVEFEHAADVDYNLRVSRLGKAVYVAIPFLLRRLHGGNLTRSHVARGAPSRDRIRLYERHARSAGLTPTELGRIRVALVSHAAYDAARALRWGRSAVARENVSSAWRYARNPPRLYLEHLRELATGVNLDEW